MPFLSPWRLKEGETRELRGARTELLWRFSIACFFFFGADDDVGDGWKEKINDKP